MAKLFCLIAAMLIWGCGPAGDTGVQGDKSTKTDSLTHAAKDSVDYLRHPNALFTLPDAERILGEKSYLKDSARSITGDLLFYRCTYTANDSGTGRSTNIYFIFESYSKMEAAQKVYSDIKTGNQNHEGFKVLQGLGDEAYFHTDNENFYFILVRKESRLFRIKVNKITGTTSLDEFNRVAREITEGI